MSDQRDGGIAWTDETWNPVRGCSRVSDGCTRCYAEGVAARFSGPGLAYEGLAKNTPSGPRWTGKVVLVPEHLEDPLRWKRPRRIFVNSMSDLFHEAVSNETIAAIFGVMAAAPQHTFQVLTKRPQRMVEWFKWHAAQTAIDGEPWIPIMREAICLLPPSNTLQDDAIARVPGRDEKWPLPNVWLGVTVENQAAADERIPLLLETPAAVRFLSCEPLLGPVSLHPTADSFYKSLAPWYGENGFDATGSQPVPERMVSFFPKIDWVIAGGESGHKARPMHINWARSLRDQCAAAGVPFFFEQWGAWRDVSSKDAAVGYYPDAQERWLNQAGGWGFHGEDVRLVRRVGKKAAGSLLDGVEHKAFPAITFKRVEVAHV